MKLNTKVILDLIAHNLNEDELCLAMDCNHHTLRQHCLNNDIKFDYTICSHELQEEIRTLRKWPPAKVAKRYNIKTTEVLSIRYGTKVVKEQTITQEMVHTQLSQDYTYKEIADFYDVTIYIIKKLAGEHDIPIAKRKLTGTQYQDVCDMILGGHPNHQIADLFSISPARVTSIKKTLMSMPVRKKYTRADPVYIKEMDNKGCTQEEIAAKLNISQATVSRHLRNK